MIIWDFKERKLLQKYDAHKVRVESVVFSLCETYVYSLGGPDDCNIIVWDMKLKEALCGLYIITSAVHLRIFPNIFTILIDYK